MLKLLAEKNRPLRILDMGTADGYLGQLLKEAGHTVLGVERDAALADQARIHYERLDVRDLEDFDFPYHREFDVIIFADVLEHVRDPGSVLKRSLATLKPNGEILISLPNVANFTVRLGLLFGRFEYGDRGILDRTHLQFFTLQTAKRMLDDCSCRCSSITPTPVPIQLVLPVTRSHLFVPFHEAHYCFVRLWKTLLAYQFVLKAVPL